MIHFLLTDRGRFTLDSFLDSSLGRPLRRRVRVVNWERLFSRRRLDPGTYLFTDLERLSARELELAAEVWSTLASSGAPVKLLNHPLRVKTRYSLLRALHETGANEFDVVRLSEARWARRYPVFLRGENDHDGSRTPLLRDEAELRAAIAELERPDPPARPAGAPDTTLVVEYCDTSDHDGVFRKYGAFFVGGRVVARHVLFGREWMLKRPYLLEPTYLEEERRYVEDNPHEGEIRALFELARIDYGRVDYSVKAGRLVVWEINTNPMIYAPRDDCDGLRREVQESFVRRFLEALEACDTAESSGERVPLRLDWPWVLPLRRRARMRLHDLLQAMGLSSLEPRLLGVLSRLDRSRARRLAAKRPESDAAHRSSEP